MRSFLLTLLLCLMSVSFIGCNRNPTTSGPVSEDSGVDMDLSKVSPNMMRVAIENMMMTPNDYIGSSVRVDGAYTSIHDDKTETDAHFLLIGTGDDCCIL